MFSHIKASSERCLDKVAERARRMGRRDEADRLNEAWPSCCAGQHVLNPQSKGREI